MPLPGDVSTFTLSFGPYTDATGAVAAAGTAGTLSPVDATGAPITVVHSASGAVIVPAKIPITIEHDGTATISGLAHTDDTHLSPQNFLYQMTWNVPPYRATLVNKTFAVPTAAGATVDYDLLQADGGTTPLVYVPVIVTSVNGHTGAVTLAASDVGADPAGAAAAVLPTQAGNGGKFLTTNGTAPSWAPAGSVGALLAANNLSDVSSAATSRTNLGLGSAATQASSAFDTAGAAASAQAASLPLQRVAAAVTASGALVANKHNPVNATSGNLTMTLPTGQAEGTQISAEKTDWTANTVTVSGNIRGLAAQSLILYWQNEDILFRADSAGSWWPVAGHKPRVAVNAAANPVGVYLPDGWGLNWHTKLASAGSSLVRIAVLGDSIGKGYFSSNLDTKGWFGLLTAALQTKYGDGGSGFKGVVDSVAWMTTNGSLTSGIRNFYNTAGCLVGSSGFASAVTGGSGAGPSGNGLKAGATTDTLTWSGGTALRGTTLKVYYLNSGAPFTVTIDGGAPQTVTPTGTTAIGVASYTVSAGSHSLVVTATGWVTGGGAGDVTIYGASGENATGVVCNNFSVYGIASGTYGNGDTLATGTWSGGFNYPADLVLYSLGVNDGHNNVAVETYLANVQGYLAGVLDTKNGGGTFTGSSAAGAADVALVIPHIGGYDSNKVWASYQARFRSLAQGYAAALVDFSAIGRRSWNYWNSLGYWASTATPGTQGTDLVHPDDAGHALMNTRLQSVLPLLP